MDATRVDRWLWAVRVYKTRSLATTGCQGGHVRVNGSPAKASTRVKVGDRVDVRIHHEDRVYEIVEVIEKRVSAPLAAAALVDHSPPPLPKDLTAPTLTRDPGTGRPTKRDRREIDRHLGR